MPPGCCPRCNGWHAVPRLPFPVGPGERDDVIHGRLLLKAAIPVLEAEARGLGAVVRRLDVAARPDRPDLRGRHGQDGSAGSTRNDRVLASLVEIRSERLRRLRRGRRRCGLGFRRFRAQDREHRGIDRAPRPRARKHAVAAGRMLAGARPRRTPPRGFALPADRWGLAAAGHPVARVRPGNLVRFGEPAGVWPDRPGSDDPDPPVGAGGRSRSRQGGVRGALPGLRRTLDNRPWRGISYAAWRASNGWTLAPAMSWFPENPSDSWDRTPVRPIACMSNCAAAAGLSTRCPG